MHASAEGFGDKADSDILERARTEDRVLAQSGALNLERSVIVVDLHRIRRRSLPLTG